MFLAELGWREFARHLLVHFPHTVTHPLRPEFAAFPWDDDPEALEAWRHGLTGYPFVDAGMRQLRATGWMHNRVRMVVASFLVKDLLLAVAGRVAGLLGRAGGRRSGKQHPWLAVGGGLRGRRGAVLPGLQPGAAGPEVRPGRGLRAHVGAGTGRTLGPLCP